MLRTFLVGAIAAYAGSRLLKANAEGRLDPLKERLRDEARTLRARMDDRSDTPDGSALTAADGPPPPAAPGATQLASSGPLVAAPDPAVSRPAPAHPWPVDPKAMPAGE